MSESSFNPQYFSISDFSTNFRRPSGVPEDDVRAHLMAVKMRHRDKLKAITKELDKETGKLKAQVLPTRKRIAEMKSKIQEKRLKLASVSKIIYNMQSLT